MTIELERMNQIFDSAVHEIVLLENKIKELQAQKDYLFHEFENLREIAGEEFKGFINDILIVVQEMEE